MRKGEKASLETRKKMSNARKGKKHSYEARQKMSLAKKGKESPRKGKKHSIDAKRKMSLAKLGGKGYWLGKKRPKISNKTRKKMSFSKLGNKCGVGNKNRLGKYHTEETKRKMSGENHPNWLGGDWSRIYPFDWTRTLKKSIRERDEYKCRICGKKQSNRTFPVHHIDYNKKNCNPDNLITLCESCHSKTNYKRENWVKFFYSFQKQ